MFGVGDFAKKIAEPAKQTAAKKLMPAPSFLFLMCVVFINVCALMLPNARADLPPTEARQPRSGTEGAIGG